MSNPELSLDAYTNRSEEKVWNLEGEKKDNPRNDIWAEQKGWMKEIFSEPENKNLEEGFEAFMWQDENVWEINEAIKEINNCKNKEEVIKIIEKYQWSKIALEMGNYGNINERIANEGAEVQITGAEVQMTGEQVKTTGEQVQTTGENAKNDVDINAVTIECKEAIEERDRLLNNSEIDEKARKDIDKITREKAEIAKQKLPQNVKDQLEERWYDDNFINDYILVRVTLNEVKGNSAFEGKYQSFENKVNELSGFDAFLKKIDNSCNIPDTWLSSFNDKNISKTRTELFHENKDIWNQYLKEAKKANMDFHERFYEWMFPKEVNENALIGKYGKLLEWDLSKFGINDENGKSIKEFWNGYNNSRSLRAELDTINNTPWKDEVYKDNETYINYKNMVNALNKIRESVENKTKDLIEEMCLITQVNWMAKCIWQEKFTFNKAKEIKIDNEGSMVLDWHIDWLDFSVRHNPTKEWSPLQVSSKLTKTWNPEDPENKNPIEIWGEWKFNDSPFKLPSQNSIFNMITNVVGAVSSSTQKIEEVDEYLEGMQRNITWEVDKIYGDAEQAHGYMREEVKSEKIVDNVMWFLGNFKEWWTKYSGVVNEKNEAYDFLNTMMFNIENSTETERGRFLDIMQRINRMAELGRNNSNDSELTNHSDQFAQYLTGKSLSNTRDILNGKTVDKEIWEDGKDVTPFAFNLFENYKKSDDRNKGKLQMLNFEQMLNDLNRVETKEKGDLASIEDGKSADADLEEAVRRVWSPEPETSSVP